MIILIGSVGFVQFTMSAQWVGISYHH